MQNNYEIYAIIIYIIILIIFQVKSLITNLSINNIFAVLLYTNKYNIILI